VDTSTTADAVSTDTATTDAPTEDTTTIEAAATDTATAADTTASPPASIGPPPLYGRHTVEAGDSFVNLALRLGTTADTLYALNDSTTASLSPGQTLRLPKRFAPPGHTVKPEETLYSIAGQYGVSVRALRAANALDTTTVQPGRRLRLPGRKAPDVPPSGDWAAPDSTGAVAVYPEAFAGRLTTSGTPYDPDDLVVSHPSLPYDTVLLLSRPDADRHTFARVIDRGPLDEGVLLDVSAAVAEQLGIDPDATPTVALRVVWVEGRPE
jgi:LysM repeat protein